MTPSTFCATSPGALPKSRRDATMFGDNNNTDDDTDNSENNSGLFSGVYDFFKPDDADDEQPETEEVVEESEPEPEPEPEPVPPEPSPAVLRWQLGNHSVDSGIDAEQFTDEIEQVEEVNPGLADVLREAQDMVEDTTVARFECGVCGLKHTHADHKHDIRGDYYDKNSPGFSVEPEFAEELEFCPYCHCGVNEFAMLIDYYGHLPQPVFTDQHKFEGVLELDNDVLIDYCRTRRDLELAAEPGDEVPLTEIVAEAGISNEAANTLDYLGEELDLFYERWLDIKRAANGAPIAGETRDAIDNLREFIDTQIAENEDEQESDEGAAESEPDGAEYTGKVVFFNPSGGYGFVRVEEIHDDVFFHADVTDTGASNLREGTKVELDVTNQDMGPRADAIRPVDEEDDDEEEESGSFY